MKQSEINHLRRLLAWVRCEIGQSPDELVQTVTTMAGAGIQLREDGKQALVEMHDEARAAPKYVRAAIKALSLMLGKRGEVIPENALPPVTPAAVALHSLPDGIFLEPCLDLPTGPEIRVHNRETWRAVQTDEGPVYEFLLALATSGLFLRPATQTDERAVGADQWWAAEGRDGVFPHADKRGWEGAAKFGYAAGVAAHAAAQQAGAIQCRDLTDEEIDKFKRAFRAAPQTGVLHSSGHHPEYVKGFNDGKREFANAFELGIQEGMAQAGALTDERIDDIAASQPGKRVTAYLTTDQYRAFARAILAAAQGGDL